MKEFIEDLKNVTKEDIIGGFVVLGYAVFAYFIIWAFSV